jgi:hypothetical protein
MGNKVFNRILMILIAVGIISVIVSTIITLVLYNQASMITFIEKEAW